MSSSAWLSIVTLLCIVGLCTIFSGIYVVFNKVITYFTQPVALNAEAIDRLASTMEAYNEILSHRIDSNSHSSTER